MKKIKILHLVIFTFLILTAAQAQIGYYDAPYVRYEGDLGTLANGASILGKSYRQSDLQSEASDQICINMNATNASVSWTTTAAGDGLVVRFNLPDGGTGALDVQVNGSTVGTLNLNTNWSWQYLSSDPNPNNAGVVNTNPKMRFDEVRMRLPSVAPAGATLKLIRTSGNISLDFAELELVPAAVTAAGGDATYDGSGLQNFINNNGGRIIFLPAGVYNVGSALNFNANNTTLKGAGSWYTQINFTSGTTNAGGLWGNATNISYSGLYLTTNNNARSNNYKGINGVYTSGSTIRDVWAIHFECGAWIANYNTIGPQWADGFNMSYCRFRNNYADGTNLCGGTCNAIVEHCSYRNNGDDDMAVWPATGLPRGDRPCNYNTFRYNTVENSWRASGCAVYGGEGNQAYNLLIKDNVEVGIRVGNNFGGYPFSTAGQHQFYNIRIVSCGTYNDLFNSAVGAIDIMVTNIAGTRINNVKFSCIDIIDSKNDAIYMYKKSGEGFFNLVFENIRSNGTGKEYPNNGSGSSNGGVRGYGLLSVGGPTGSGTQCNMTYANRGGNAGVDVQLNGYSLSTAGSCPSGCTLLLPVDLINFTAEVKSENVVLSWSTSMEKNNDKFFIERSQDNSDWKSIGEVAGVGNVNSIVNYNFNDEDPLEGKTYYRLCQVDVDGKATYSEIVLVKITDQSFTIAPNPFENAFMIEGDSEDEMEILIYDILGQEVYHGNQIGSQIIHPNIPSGTYIITIQTDTSIEKRKLIKK